MKPIHTPLGGFTGNRLLPLGTVSLTRVVNFLVVDYLSAYNVILGRPMLNRIKVVTLTYHLLMRFLIKGEVGEVKGDQVVARECYMASLKGEPTLKENMSIDSLEV